MGEMEDGRRRRVLSLWKTKQGLTWKSYPFLCLRGLGGAGEVGH